MDILVLNHTQQLYLESSSGTCDIVWSVHYADSNAAGITEGSFVGEIINSAAEAMVADAPSADTRRVVRNVLLYNNLGSTITVSVIIKVSGSTDYIALKVTLAGYGHWAFGAEQTSSDSESGTASFYIDQSDGASNTYGALGGNINNMNCIFTVSQKKYLTGTLKVWLNGLLQTQGTDSDWVETSPDAGTFTFETAPLYGDQITVEYALLNFTNPPGPQGASGPTGPSGPGQIPTEREWMSL